MARFYKRDKRGRFAPTGSAKRANAISYSGRRVSPIRLTEADTGRIQAKHRAVTNAMKYINAARANPALARLSNLALKRERTRRYKPRSQSQRKRRAR
jgi:hypothetical protein